LKPDDIYSLPTVSDPRLSPDGSTVAFVVTRADREGDTYRSTIWLVPTDGDAPPRGLTAGDHRDGTPRWSPDGRQLAFTSDRGGDRRDLYVVSVAGGEPRRLTGGAGPGADGSAGAPAWSPDGTLIAFTAVLGATDEIRSRHLRKLRYKADGAGWTLGRYSHVFIVAADGSAPPRQMTDGDFNNVDPAWSPDGTRLAIGTYREEDGELCTAVDIHTLDVATGALRRLTSGDHMISKPSWSPDGRYIAARSYPDITSSPRHSQVLLIDVEARSSRLLTTELDLQCGPYLEPREPMWVPDGILFAVEDNGRCHLYTVDLDGHTKPVMTGDIVISDHDADAHTIVHVMSTSTEPTELWCGSRRLTRFTDRFRSTVGMSAAQEFTAASRDGSEVHAWFMPPQGAQPGQKYPTLVFIHGGPFTQYGIGFFDEFQVATGAGYAVVYSNPRGSSGYSEAWGRAIRGPISGGPGWGTVDAEDILAVTSEACRRFDLCDSSRLGVLGGSYGGFMTAWLLGHSSVFAAGCAERGIYNVVSSIGTSDGLWSSSTVWGGDPFDHLDDMMRISPITYVNEMTAPVLLVHSEQDLRCPVEQAEQLFTALRLRGRDVELLRFVHGTHDLSRGGPPQDRVARFEAIMGWFDAHL